MIVDQPCKFCRKIVHVKIDDDYAKMRDPYKLMPLLSCNRCADYRHDRRLVEEKIRDICLTLLASGAAKEDVPKIREHLTKLIQRYMRLIADYRDLPMPDWDNALVDDMLSKPGNYALILGQVPKMFQQPQLM